MAKTIITKDGDILNYDNILSIYVEENSEEKQETYLLNADVVARVTYILGEYETKAEAENEREKLIEWLNIEAFGVYSVGEKHGE